jgi:hypothetical protein
MDELSEQSLAQNESGVHATSAETALPVVDVEESLTDNERIEQQKVTKEKYVKDGRSDFIKHLEDEFDGVPEEALALMYDPIASIGVFKEWVSKRNDNGETNTDESEDTLDNSGRSSVFKKIDALSSKLNVTTEKVNAISQQLETILGMKLAESFVDNIVKNMDLSALLDMLLLSNYHDGCLQSVGYKNAAEIQEGGGNAIDGKEIRSFCHDDIEEEKNLLVEGLVHANLLTGEIDVWRTKSASEVLEDGQIKDAISLLTSYSNSIGNRDKRLIGFDEGILQSMHKDPETDTLTIDAVTYLFMLPERFELQQKYEKKQPKVKE